MAINLPPEIDVNDRRPRVAIAFDNTSGIKQLPPNPKIVLLVGQALAAAVQPVATPVQLFRETDSELLFVAGSMIDMMAKAAYLANDQVELWAVSAADAVGATAATYVNTFAVTALVDGAYELYVAGKRYVTEILTGDTPTAMATNHCAVINDIPTCPISAANAAGVVTYTTKSKGLEMNNLQLRGRFTASGQGTTSTLTTAGPGAQPMTGGTGTTDFTAALASAAGMRYHDVAIGLGDSTTGTAVRTWVNSQGDAEHDKGQIAIQGMTGTLSAATTAAIAINGARSEIFALRGSESAPWEIAAAVASVMSSETRATMPYNTLPLNGIVPPPIASRWIASEQKVLINNGVSPLLVGPGEIVQIQRAVVTYTVNPLGAADYSLLDVTIIQAFDRVRDATVAMFQTNYGRARWAADDTDGLLPDDVATPAKVTQDLFNTLIDLEEEGTVQNVTALKSQIVVEKVGTNCQFSMPADIVDGLHEVLGKVVHILTPLAQAQR